MVQIAEGAVSARSLEKTDSPRPDVALLAIVAGIVVLALVVFIRHCRYPGIDDAFITYRYARNLAAGLGWVYNPGERVQGASTPFFTAWLALISKTGIAIPLISRATGALSMCATLVVIFLWLRRIQSAFAGLVPDMSWLIPRRSWRNIPGILRR